MADSTKCTACHVTEAINLTRRCMRRAFPMREEVRVTNAVHADAYGEHCGVEECILVANTYFLTPTYVQVRSLQGTVQVLKWVVGTFAHTPATREEPENWEYAALTEPLLLPDAITRVAELVIGALVSVELEYHEIERMEKEADDYYATS